MCDVIIDRAAMRAMLAAAEKNGDALLKEYAETVVAVANIKIAVRSVKTEKGLDYEAFLMLLLAEKNNRMYYRMCDLIQLNTALVQDGFLITNCVDAFTIDIDITKGKRSYATSVSAVY